MNKQIVMIKTEQLEHHPDNPRKNIGDITELTASISTDGILQNLTIVPKPEDTNKYYVVIGNRRLEAGTAAGLAEFPCVISDMDYNKQLETMLIENINRSDLTPLEEAEGFKQLTLAGYSVDDIADKTGFSKSTINRRLKIAEYNKSKAVKAIERGGTLEDFAKIEKIRSKREREKLINSMGTENFLLDYKRALNDQIVDDNKKLARKLLKGIATEISSGEAWTSKYTWDPQNNSIDLTKELNEKKLKLKGKKEHFFYFGYNSLNWKLKSEKQQKTEVKKSEQQIDQEKNLKNLNKLAAEFYQLRCDFIDSLINCKHIKDYQDICIKTLLKTSVFSYVNIRAGSDLFEKIGLKYDYSCGPEQEWLNVNNFFEKYNDHAAGILINIVYNTLDDSKAEGYHQHYTFNGYAKNISNRGLDITYDFLKAVGYQMSDEEKQYRDGTHPLFIKEKQF